jgi:hypothetical protein
MFQFPRFAHRDLWIQSRASGHYPTQVSPFGHPRIEACLRLPEAYRSLPDRNLRSVTTGQHSKSFHSSRILSDTVPLGFCFGGFSSTAGYGPMDKPAMKPVGP